MEPLKNMFDKKFYLHLSEEIHSVNSDFPVNKFIKEVTHNINDLSLNQRLRNTSIHLKQNLPLDYKKAIHILSKTILNTQRGYTNLVFPDFVGLYGHDDFDISMNALKHFTQFGSSEFAIREFLKRDFDKTIKVMINWAKDKNYHVRRLASEGSRPRLPWSFKLDAVITQPKKTQIILETLKADEELYVKKSVANHLNDLSKDNTDYMLQLIKNWDNTNKHTAWIIKHASRTLIKKGNVQSLAIFEYEKTPKLKLQNFKLKNSTLKLGNYLEFTFDLISEKTKNQKLVVDYVIHYNKSNGELSPKVFKLKDIDLNAKEKTTISKKQLFKDFTTRKHYAGKHFVEIQINGLSIAKSPFYLTI